tara:strand:- start:437 stop:673 length:237 start_codon:yes stop_codon:yes gene_type:complete
VNKNDIMNKRLFEIVTNKLIVEKSLLEGELERVLQEKELLTFNELADKAVELSKKISQVMTAISLWESYNNNLNKEEE